MKLSAFEQIIRKVVREEIDYALKREINSLKEGLNPSQHINESNNTQELETFRNKLKSQIPTPSFNTGDDTLNSLLTETATTPTWEERAAVNDPVNQFVNKDYSQLMSAIDNKKNYRP